VAEGFLNRDDIRAGLEQLGQIAVAQNMRFELVVIGGACMVLAYNARVATRDVDVAILRPQDASRIREAARMVAAERNWPEDWLNDAAQGYLVGLSEGPTVFSAPGIEVRRPSVAQLLAMKLSAWRDDVDIADARRLLQELSPVTAQEAAWKMIEPYLVPGRQLKARYAFLDIWEALYGDA